MNEGISFRVRPQGPEVRNPREAGSERPLHVPVVDCRVKIEGPQLEVHNTLIKKECDVVTDASGATCFGVGLHAQVPRMIRCGGLTRIFQTACLFDQVLLLFSFEPESLTR